jgi:hypothetical protein
MSGGILFEISPFGNRRNTICDIVMFSYFEEMEKLPDPSSNKNG